MPPKQLPHKTLHTPVPIYIDSMQQTSVSLFVFECHQDFEIDSFQKVDNLSVDLYKNRRLTNMVLSRVQSLQVLITLIHRQISKAVTRTQNEIQLQSQLQRRSVEIISLKFERILLLQLCFLFFNNEKLINKACLNCYIC